MHAQGGLTLSDAALQMRRHVLDPPVVFNLAQAHELRVLLRHGAFGHGDAQHALLLETRRNVNRFFAEHERPQHHGHIAQRGPRFAHIAGGELASGAFGLLKHQKPVGECALGKQQGAQRVLREFKRVEDLRALAHGRGLGLRLTCVFLGRLQVVREGGRFRDHIRNQRLLFGELGALGVVCCQQIALIVLHLLDAFLQLGAALLRISRGLLDGGKVLNVLLALAALLLGSSGLLGGGALRLGSGRSFGGGAIAFSLLGGSAFDLGLTRQLFLVFLFTALYLAIREADERGNVAVLNLAHVKLIGQRHGEQLVQKRRRLQPRVLVDPIVRAGLGRVVQRRDGQHLRALATAGLERPDGVIQRNADQVKPVALFHQDVVEHHQLLRHGGHMHERADYRQVVDGGSDVGATQIDADAAPGHHTQNGVHRKGHLHVLRARSLRGVGRDGDECRGVFPEGQRRGAADVARRARRFLRLAGGQKAHRAVALHAGANGKQRLHGGGIFHAGGHFPC